MEKKKEKKRAVAARVRENLVARNLSSSLKVAICWFLLKAEIYFSIPFHHIY